MSKPPKEPYTHAIDLNTLVPKVEVVLAEDKVHAIFFVDTHRPLQRREMEAVFNLYQDYYAGDLKKGTQEGRAKNGANVFPPHEYWIKEAVNTDKPLFRNFWKCRLKTPQDGGLINAARKSRKKLS